MRENAKFPHSHSVFRIIEIDFLRFSIFVSFGSNRRYSCFWLYLNKFITLPEHIYVSAHIHTMIYLMPTRTHTHTHARKPNAYTRPQTIGELGKGESESLIAIAIPFGGSSSSILFYFKFNTAGNCTIRTIRTLCLRYCFLLSFFFFYLILFC